jgi:tripartite-type tricarboxylate transporter receptor subunit TctC
MRRAGIFFGMAALAAALLVPGLVRAQPYPNRPIRLVVPFPAGGTADFVARLAGERLATQLRATVVVENRVGANGNLGTEQVAQAAPDGYTLLLGSTPNLAINPSLYKKLKFDPLKDFVPVVQLAIAPNVLVVHPSVPAPTVAELIRHARAQPGNLRFASGGNGSTGHLAMEMLAGAAQLQVLHVPYRGGPQAVTDLIGGQVDALFFTVPTVLPHVQSGRLRALAVAAPRRSSALPNVPTLAEAGLPGVDASPWFGLLAPAGTPKAIVNRLAIELARSWQDNEVRSKLLLQGAEPSMLNPDGFAQLLRADIKRWAAAVSRSGATID